MSPSELHLWDVMSNYWPVCYVSKMQCWCRARPVLRPDTDSNSSVLAPHPVGGRRKHVDLPVVEPQGEHSRQRLVDVPLPVLHCLASHLRAWISMPYGDILRAALLREREQVGRIGKGRLGTAWPALQGTRPLRLQRR